MAAVEILVETGRTVPWSLWNPRVHAALLKAAIQALPHNNI